MIGIGFLVLGLLIGLRLVWMVLRHRGITLFVALIGLVAIESFARAATKDTTSNETAPAAQRTAPTDPVLACQTRQTAIAACTAAIDSGTWHGAELAWAYNNRGIAHAARGDALKALADYSKAIELAPGDASAWSNRGSLHATLGDLHAALADHEKALELAPANASAWHNRGVDHEELGQHSKALQDYRKAIELDPGHRGSHIGLATAACKLGRIKASVAARLALIDKGLITAVEMQQILQQDGFYKGPLDGLFGKGSRAALRAWTRKGCLAQA